ncbi:putative methyltransferase nsun6 [Rhizophlyctis rosea]|uniref:Methyltransferase nsun6 n=1 Tax=Rhizophlyctis rosea TaxID=64517 RepID=A0AAD5SEN9_9FUNG|nr:putative methyltransferase nsun6 [Rhizophlyctis rosea]
MPNNSLPPITLSQDVEDLLSSGYTTDEWASIRAALATPPRTTFLRVNTLKCSRDEALLTAQRFVDEQCKTKNWLPMSVKIHPTLRDVLYIHVEGPLDVSPSVSEVMVDALCGNAVLRGADIFAAGVLAAESPMKAGDKVSVYVDLDRACLRGQSKKYTGKKAFLGNGVSLLGRDDLFTVAAADLKGRGIGILMTEPLYRSPSLSDLFSDGLSLQNFPSILVGHALNPQPGETILDMCAAPGGKTMHIATLMQNQGTLIALDRSAQKVTRLSKFLQSQNISSARAYTCDASSCVMSDPETQEYRTALENGTWKWPNSGSKLKKLPREGFDRILLDGPCSAMGQRPNFLPSLAPAILTSYPQYQRSLLHSAHRLLRPGGTLVYSTCTISTQENEGNVAYALRTFEDLELVDVSQRVGGKVGMDGVDGKGLSEVERRMCWRFPPGVACGTGLDGEELESIGFFFAVYRKRIEAGGRKGLFS